MQARHVPCVTAGAGALVFINCLAFSVFVVDPEATASGMWW
jgi:hypothetical protein